MSKTTRPNSVSVYIKRHQVSLGLLLAAYGAFYLAAVIMGNWTPADWGKDIFGMPSFPNAVLQRSYIGPFFFVTSVPALIVGAVLLCAYCIQGLGSRVVDDKEHVAVVLVVFGFAYTVLGAWPLGKTIDFPWEWQKQIASFGSLFSWGLYSLSVIILAVGAVSLYCHSRRYHQMHPDQSPT
jgi:hypothetical protein